MKSRIFWTTIATLIMTFFINTTAMAATNFIFNLEPGQEVPPVVSSGSGSCQVALVATFVSVNCTFQNVSTPAIAAHIHSAGVGVNGGVILPLTPTATTSGTITGNGSLTAQQAVDMQMGLTYINLHTQAHPPGEIRGQVVGVVDTTAIPTMSQWGMISLMFLFMLAGFLVFRHKRIKRN